MFLLLQNELRQMVAQGLEARFVNTSFVGGTLAALARQRMSLANKLFSALLNRSSRIRSRRHSRQCCQPRCNTNGTASECVWLAGSFGSARIVTPALLNRVTGGSCGNCRLAVSGSSHIYPTSPLSLTADLAHSVQVSDLGERHSRELPTASFNRV